MLGTPGLRLCYTQSVMGTRVKLTAFLGVGWEGQEGKTGREGTKA